MKTLISFIVVAFLCVTSVFADDASIVANWQFPIIYWFPEAVTIPSGGIANYPSPQAVADSIVDFDPVGVVFDDVWAGLTSQGVSGNGYQIAKQNGNPASAHGSSDFSSAFKVVYDQNTINILIKTTDDNIDGREVVELMWAPYFDIPAIASLPSVIADTKKGDITQQSSHARYAQFGGYKASFTANGYRDAHIIDFNAAGVGNIGAAATNSLLKNNLSYENKTELGSHTVKAIYTIGFQALTGNAYAVGNARPTFNNAIWRTLNGGKGISFDIKMADADPDDQLNNAVPPVEQPGEYWWSANHNDGWAETYYSGFLGINKNLTAVKSVYSNKQVIFGKVTSTQVQLIQNANVEVFNTIGKRVLSLKNTNNIDLANLRQGVYIIRANNESLKFVR